MEETAGDQTVVLLLVLHVAHLEEVLAEEHRIAESPDRNDEHRDEKQQDGQFGHGSDWFW